MRFSSTAILALPLLAAAAESPFEQYKAKFQNFISSFGAAAPAADQAQPAAAASSPKSKAKVGPKKIENLTLENWKDTVYAPVKPDATTPEEWYILVSGGNKTCYGHCTKLDAAFKESAVKFATQSKSPHLARLDCEDQQVLCNSWGASAGSLWVFEMLPTPAPIDVYWKPLNLSTVSTQTILDLQAKPVKENFRFVESYFHPFDGILAQYNLAVPIGYILYGFNVIPSWAFMLIVSFLSRSVMNRQMDPAGGRPGAPRGAAPPGDARS
ncbi:hypothetical protein B0T16DRAFT_242775 [Cercophora newfieldiana]|uniref:Peptidyl-tRNA hydrolase n=1 Tax=Cercophora newfieldiana TaxID=92897 RepID=A0AA39XSD0_9PEZI|nr:hypothetical protein B0T16DRAFT_242775 [Cercophora newfieldiana]